MKLHLVSCFWWCQDLLALKDKIYLQNKVKQNYDFHTLPYDCFPPVIIYFKNCHCVICSRRPNVPGINSLFISEIKLPTDKEITTDSSKFDQHWKTSNHACSFFECCVLCEQTKYLTSTFNPVLLDIVSCFLLYRVSLYLSSDKCTLFTDK